MILFYIHAAFSGFADATFLLLPSVLTKKGIFLDDLANILQGYTFSFSSYRLIDSLDTDCRSAGTFFLLSTR